MDCAELADEIAVRLEGKVKHLPDGFYDSFDFTQTGHTLTHPITCGFLAHILQGMPWITHVGIDIRLNLGKKAKFQPDLAGFDGSLEPVAFVDYESPNSSDARVPTKDVDAYLAWRRKSGLGVPYVIVTTLPDRPSENWELRYTSPGQYNERFRGRKDEVRRNPYRFWYGLYLDEFSRREMTTVALVNIDGKAVRRVYPS